MYFNDKNNFFHGIMFHHFHDDAKHLKSQGSISKKEFYKIVEFIGRKNILDADIFFDKFKNNKLKNNEVCFTFDDAIKCQIDVALPVLEDLKIKSFFFVYSSMFDGNPDNLEIFRHFRMNYFKNINEFYEKFYEFLESDLDKIFRDYNNKINKTKNKFPHYSFDDIKFRLIRDEILNKKQYEEIMFKMMEERKFQYKEYFSKLFFDARDLQKLDDLGHIIGLHSHTHPTSLEKLNYEQQKMEYEKCLSVLSNILKKNKSNFKCMSHPCGSYNLQTLKILEELGVELGFKQIMTVEPEKGMKKINNSFLEIARQDHAEIIVSMNK